MFAVMLKHISSKAKINKWEVHVIAQSFCCSIHQIVLLPADFLAGNLNSNFCTDLSDTINFFFFQINWENRWVSVHHEWIKGGTVIWATQTSVRAAHLLQTVEGGRALLEATCSCHRSVAELSLVRMEVAGGALPQCWSWFWTINSVPSAHSCSPQAEEDAPSLGEADIVTLFILWCDHQHNGEITQNVKYQLHQPVRAELTVLFPPLPFKNPCWVSSVVIKPPTRANEEFCSSL